MKTTIDIPDDLYRRVKARSALEGRMVRDVAIELFRRWAGEPSITSTQWIADLMAHRLPTELPGPTAREILETDRNRLERQHADG